MPELASELSNMHESYSSGVSVAPHLRCLRAVGFCRRAGGAGVAGAAYHAFALAATTTYVLQQLAYAYEEKSDMEKLSRVMFVLLCHVTCVAKQVVFRADADRIERLVAGLDDALFNCGDERARALRAGTARDAVRLLRWYAGCAVATCLLWILFPILYRLQGRSVELPFWIGFDYQDPFMFSLVLLYSFYTTTLVAVGNTTMDAFMATILCQCKTQLTIVRTNFETLPERAKAMLLKRSVTTTRKRAAVAARLPPRDDYDIVLYKLFIECLIHYKKITECCHLLQDIFGSALLVQFTIGGWILCMAAYKIVSVPVLSIEFASTTLFIICILTELFLYCYYGNEVTVESDRVVESLYAMEWHQTPARFRRSLVVVMERAKRPLRPVAGRVIPLTLDTYVKILKSSYSFYAVLRQTK